MDSYLRFICSLRHITLSLQLVISYRYSVISLPADNRTVFHIKTLLYSPPSQRMTCTNPAYHLHQVSVSLGPTQRIICIKSAYHFHQVIIITCFKSLCCFGPTTHWFWPQLPAIFVPTAVVSLKKSIKLKVDLINSIHQAQV